MALHAQRAIPNERLRGGEMSYDTLSGESDRFRGRGGVSEEARALGYRPAFRHRCTGEIFPALDDRGHVAAVHLLGGIPTRYVTRRDPASGTVIAVSADIEAGFVRGGRFCTRDEAARCR